MDLGVNSMVVSLSANLYNLLRKEYTGGGDLSDITVLVTLEYSRGGDLSGYHCGGRTAFPAQTQKAERVTHSIYMYICSPKDLFPSKSVSAKVT